LSDRLFDTHIAYVVVQEQVKLSVMTKDAYLSGFSRPSFTNQHKTLILIQRVNKLVLVFPNGKRRPFSVQLPVLRREWQSCKASSAQFTTHCREKHHST